MIELDMVYVSYFGEFLSKGSRESFEQDILFRLIPPRKAAGPAWPLRNTESISKYARLPPPSVSPKSLDHGLRVYH
jgi:hypothetical protein